ncbi:hypothetical protein DB43_BR00010 [Parachlamydia acanthamoebae]|uniref:Uncharacterized protein n=2 Tax=Parachlamydia acanthamoebae TaxID=83552 RepID=A0A0C1BWU7_9BACT|nr:hypothetical protein DB43_BR00010 [Parachlamydia acanthamoebae]
MAAQNMFMHTLSARIGESRHTSAYQASNTPTGWARITFNHSKNEAVSGKLSKKKPIWMCFN